MKRDQTGFENVNQSDYFGGYPTAHIDARIIDGKIIDLRDETEINLKDGALVRIVAYKSDIPEEFQERFHDQRKKILDAGERIWFSVLDKTGNPVEFEIVLHDDAYMIKEGNKLSRFSCFSMMLLPTETSHVYLAEPMPISTLNQAYRLMSVRVNAEGSSHTTNVYSHFQVIGGKTLKYYRI